MINFFPAALCVLQTVLCLQAYEEHEPAAPRDVHFLSVNLRNTVRWSSGDPNTQGTTYTVEYAKYGDAVDVEGGEQVVWRSVQQCVEISHTECEVTDQTGDTEEEYYVRVRANGPEGHSEWTETDRRLRLADTVLGPPQLNVSVVENKLQVKLNGPFRWRSPGKKRQSMFNIFPHMVYNISLYTNSSKHMQHFLQVKKLLQHGPLEYNSEYCVRAEVLSMSLHLTNIPSDWICISTTDDPFKSQMLLLMLGGILPTAVCLFVLVAVGGFAYHYICGHKQKLPKSVKDIQRDVEVEKKLQTFQPEKHLPTINVIIINNTTNLSAGESKHTFPSPLHHGVDVPETLLLLGEKTTMGGAYAAQNVQQTSKAATSCPKSCRSSLNEEYCWVHQEERNQVACCPYNSQVVPQCVGGVSSYMAQTGITEQAQETYEEEKEEEEEMQSTFCNWDPDTGHLRLDFPLLSRFSLETSETTETQKKVTETHMPRRPDLGSVVVKQPSEEAVDDDLLLNLEKHWDLQVQSSTE